MIILDTNVISALMTDTPDATVARWLDSRSPASIWTTSITIFELRVGIENLPVSRKRWQLEDEFARVVREDIQDRILVFDATAVQEAAALSGARRRRGRPVDTRDTLIAGIVLSRHAEFATRNVRHFADLDLPVIDPWAV